MMSNQLMSELLAGSEVTSINHLLQQVENDSLIVETTWLIAPVNSDIALKDNAAMRSERLLCK